MTILYIKYFDGLSSCITNIVLVLVNSYKKLTILVLCLASKTYGPGTSLTSFALGYNHITWGVGSSEPRKVLGRDARHTRGMKLPCSLYRECIEVSECRSSEAGSTGLNLVSVGFSQLANIS